MCARLVTGDVTARAREPARSRRRTGRALTPMRVLDSPSVPGLTSAPVEAPPVPRAQLEHQPALDGLRGVALVAVLFYHGGFGWARGGFLWVSTFFTLSGFLITSLVMAEHRVHGHVSRRGFWSRRARRLLPASLVTLLVVAAYGAWWADGSQLARLRGDGLAALANVANWRFVATDSGYAALFASPSPVQHFWSLAIEEQWYLVFPLVVGVVLRVGRGRWTVVGGAFALVGAASGAWTLHLAGSGASVERLYFGTDTRAAELALGVVVAVVVGTWPLVAVRLGTWARSLAPLALVGMAAATATVAHTDRWLYPTGLWLWSLGSAVLVVAAVQPSGAVRAGLSIGPLAWLGTRSYGGYLLHWPVFLALDADRVGLGPAPLFAVRVAVTLALTGAVFRTIEDPIRRHRRVTASQARVALPLAVVAVVAALVLVTAGPARPSVSLGGSPGPPPEVPPRAPTQEPTGAPPGSSGDTPEATTDTPSPTTPADPSTAPPAGPAAGTAAASFSRVLVVGDSQAWVLGQGLERWAVEQADRAAVWNVAVEGCGLVRGGTVEGWEGQLNADCDDWPRQWADALERFEPDVVVVLSGPWDRVPRRLPDWDTTLGMGDPAFDAHVVAEYGVAASLLAGGGARVVWLTSPCAEWDAFTGDDPEYLNTVLLPRVVDAVPGLEIVDLAERLCPGGRFSGRLGGIEDARPDGIHLSDPAADWVASWLLPEVLGLADPATPPP